MEGLVFVYVCVGGEGGGPVFFLGVVCDWMIVQGAHPIPISTCMKHCCILSPPLVGRQQIRKDSHGLFLSSCF